MTRRPWSPIVALLIAWALALPAPAAEGDAAGAAATGADRVARFVDEQTLLAGTVDLSGVDPRAVAEFASAVIKAALPDPAEHKEPLEQIAGGMEQVGLQLKAWQDAGASRLWVLVKIANMQPQPVVLIPLPAGKDPEALKRLLDGIALGNLRTAVVGDVLVASTPDYLPKVIAAPAAGGDANAAAAADSPVKLLAGGLDSAPRSPVRIVLLGTPSTKALAAAAGFAIPRNVFDVWGILTKTRWATLGVNLPPGPSATVTFQATNPEGAKFISESLKTALAALRKNPDFVAAVANVDRVMGMIEPAVADDRVSVDLTADEVNAFVKDELPPIVRRAREQAMRVASANNLRQFYTALTMHANENQGEFPADLAAIEKYLGDAAPRVLVNPAAPNQRPGYTYVRPPAGANRGRLAIAATRIPLVYESFDKFPPGGIQVLFLSGHIERVADQARFDELVKAATAPPAANP